jgi:hypothetical protein
LTPSTVATELFFVRLRFHNPGLGLCKAKAWRELEMRFVRNFCFLGLLPACAMTASGPVSIKGVIICKALSSKAEERLLPTGIEGGMIVAEAQTRESESTPACQKSGYGIFTWEQKFLAFDAVGSHKALEAIKASKRLDDLEAEVTGVVVGNTVKVETLKLVQ